MIIQYKSAKKQNLLYEACLAIFIVFVMVVLFGLFFHTREDKQPPSAQTGAGYAANLRSGHRPVADDRIHEESNNGALCVLTDRKGHNRREGSRMSRQLVFSVEAMLRQANHGIAQGMDLVNLRLLQQGRPEEQLLLVEKVRLLI